MDDLTLFELHDVEQLCDELDYKNPSRLKTTQVIRELVDYYRKSDHSFNNLHFDKIAQHAENAAWELEKLNDILNCY